MQRLLNIADTEKSSDIDLHELSEEVYEEENSDVISMLKYIKQFYWRLFHSRKRSDTYYQHNCYSFVCRKKISRLKVIKTYLRISVTQNWLVEYSISVENKVTHQFEIRVHLCTIVYHY